LYSSQSVRFKAGGQTDRGSVSGSALTLISNQPHIQQLIRNSTPHIKRLGRENGILLSPSRAGYKKASPCSSVVSW